MLLTFFEVNWASTWLVGFIIGPPFTVAVLFTTALVTIIELT